MSLIQEFLWEAKNGNVVGVEVCIKRDTTIMDEIDNDGMTAIMYAAQNGHIHVIDKILHYNGNVDLVENYSGDSAIMLAAWNQQFDTVLYLLSKGANVRIKNKNFYTVFDYCRQKFSKEEVIKIQDKRREYVISNSNKKNDEY